MREAPSACHCTVSPARSPWTTRTYSRRSARRIAGNPIVLRAVNPVPTPNAIRPGASLSRVAKPLAAAGAMRLVGTSTPVASWMRLVRTAASAMETKTSAQSIWVS